MKSLASVRSMDMKEQNRLHILATIRRAPCSRAEISTILGMSKPAVSALVDELLQEALIVEKGRGGSTEAGGKRPIILDLNCDFGVVLAVHFNNEQYEIALSTLTGDIIAYDKGGIQVQHDYKETLQPVIAASLNMLHAHKSRGYSHKLIGCGISVKGLIDAPTGIMRYSAGFPAWRDVPIADAFAEALHVPVFVENDARAGTFALLLGEQEIKPNIATLNVGLGIGTGVAIHGEVYRGSSGGAVTFAHTIVSSDGPLCDCGKHGCWESLASISALLKELCRRSPSYTGLHYRQVLAKYEAGDEIVRDVLLHYTAHWLGIGISNMLGVFNPEQLFVLGDITLAPQEVRDTVIATALANSAPICRSTPITFVDNSADQFMIKAAAAVMIEQFFSLQHHRGILEKMVI